MCVRTYVRACVCACMRMCLHAYVPACVCACIRMCVHTYVRAYICVSHAQECQFALICNHLHLFALTCTLRNHGLRALTMEVEDREERRFLTMEDAEDIATGPPQRMCFAESSAERSRRLATLRKRKQRSQSTKDAKRARREPDKVQK